MADDPSRRDDDKLDQLLREIARTPTTPIHPRFSREFIGSSRYETVRRLGQGGCGVVWLVRGLSDGGELALKTLPAWRPELIYRLKREFRALADLRHPNLVSLYELVADEERCFFTMEYVPGTSFVEHVRPGGALDVERLRRALAQLVQGLDALHGAGKLHRDVKPSNVLVERGGRVVLLDFGLATEIEASGLGRSAELAGTPQYMSPEHDAGQPLGPASDWYSVGAMLYLALTGRLPFEGKTPVELAMARRNAEAPSPVEACPEIARPLAELCRALLARDPAQRPGAARILAALGSPANAELRSADSEPPLIGRGEELEVLRRALAEVQNGRGVTVLVEGTSGIGKTTLVQQFLAEAERDAGATVLRGRCYEHERVPYQGIDSLVDDLCRLLRGIDPASAAAILPRHVRALVRLFPILERVPSVAAGCGRGPHGSGDEQESRSQAFGALRELLARAADRHVLLLHIDDLQWGDLDTGALLREILRAPDAPAMLLVLSYRSEDAGRSRCLQALASAEIGEPVRLPVGPLTAEAGAVLARRLLGARSLDAEAARIVAEAGGAPLFISELARFVAERADQADGRGPLDLSAALRWRVERLPPAARALLETVAVAGRPVAEPVALRAARLAEAPRSAWDVLRSERLVRFSGPLDRREVEPFHDRIRESVAAGLSRRRAVQCHRELAAALEEAGGADPVELAHHHEAAGDLGRARSLAIAAAAQAEQALAFDRAARLYRWALGLEQAAPSERRHLLESLAGALGNAGRGVEAARTYLEAAAGEVAGARDELRRRAGHQLLYSGRIDEGRVLASEDLRAKGFPIPKSSRRALASLLLHRAYLRVRGLGYRERSESQLDPERLEFLDHLFAVSRGLSFVDSMRGAELGTRFLLLALDSGVPRRVAQGLTLVAGHAAAEAPTARRTAALIDRLDQLAQRLSDKEVEGHALMVRALRTYTSGEWRSSRMLCGDAERMFRELKGMVWEMCTMRTIATWSLFYLGDWRELAQRVVAEMDEARDRGNSYALTCACAPFGVTAWLIRGDVEGARRNLREAVDSWTGGGFGLQHHRFLKAALYVDLYAGDGPTAWARMQENWKRLAGSLVLRLPIVRVQVLHLRGCCALAAASAAAPGSAPARALLDEAASMARRLERFWLPMAHPLGDLLWAGVAAAGGRTDEAVRRLDAALREFERQEMGAYAAAARRGRACLLGEENPTASFAGQDVADPGALARMLAPGLER